MILYKLGLSNDAFSIPTFDIVIVFTLFIISLVLAIFVASNLSDNAPYPSSRINEFLQDHQILTCIITLVLSLLAAIMIGFSSEMVSETAPNTIVESQYILKNSTRNTEVKDDFKTIYENEEDVEFSSSLQASTRNNLPQDLLDDLRSKGIFESHSMSSKSDEDFTIFSTKEDLNLQQVEAMRILSKRNHVIEINASKADSSVKVLATIDSVELTKEEDNEENMTYHIDEIEMANAVETISRDSQSKSRDIKTVKIHISGKTSESAKARKSIEKLVE